jgi:hypothetical protein
MGWWAVGELLSMVYSPETSRAILTVWQSEMHPTPTRTVSSPLHHILAHPISNAPKQTNRRRARRRYSHHGLIIALFTSYILHTRKIQAVHETVLSIFAGTFLS